MLARAVESDEDWDLGKRRQKRRPRADAFFEVKPRLLGVDLLLIVSPPASNLDDLRLQLHGLCRLSHLVEIERVQEDLRDQGEDDDRVAEIIGTKASQLIIDKLDHQFIDVRDLLNNVEAGIAEYLSVVRKVVGKDTLRQTCIRGFPHFGGGLVRLYLSSAGVGESPCGGVDGLHRTGCRGSIVHVEVI